MDRDHACVRCKASPVKKIDINTRECPACATRFTVGVMPPQPPGRREFLARHEASRELGGLVNFPRGRNYFGRFGQ
jgi:hypothetical protein